VVKRARALIVEKDPAFRASLRAALGDRLHVVGEVRDEEEACAFTSAEPVDLIVMSLPRPGGFDAARELLERDPAVVVVLLGRQGHADDAPLAATARAYGRSSFELGELSEILLGLGSLPRRPGGPRQALDAESRGSRASSPCTAAQRLAFARLSTWSFRYTFDRWNFTVCSLTQSISASSEFEKPCAMSWRISTSRGVRSTPPMVCVPVGTTGFTPTAGGIAVGTGGAAGTGVGRKIESLNACWITARSSSAFAVFTT
jgi:CheY-like chemotaxis protein